MLLIARSSISFGTFADRYRKLSVMRFAAGFTLVMFVLAGIIMIAAALLAVLTPVYLRVPASYAQTAAEATAAG